MSSPSPGARAAPPRSQDVVGLVLAVAVVAAWLFLHVAGVFWLPLQGSWLWVLPGAVALQTWLSVGLFIVAHDAMHRSLAPGWPRLATAIGRVCVALYAGFSYERLRDGHRRHHQFPGTAADPDFHAERPHAFAPWLLRFFGGYFGWREFARVTAVLGVYLLLGAAPLNLALMWGLPAVLSALQLFIVGTWLPHRHRHGHDPAKEFVDHGRARSLDLPWLASLLACFHFGLHREHHACPHVPWWRLPAVRHVHGGGAG
ncbi:fatty acid desaturase [Ramlibacter sp. AW1]|uniref:Fatty acid desaturase n=1 Tax=Ramlibacter aurantiacus TaxID=2801330 RepID=A0A937D204_9BURK|nr:fatty acid desaturase [Ramlibacter aurantiacus]MBL0419285.1 fatty acid desaturase [Ramlibacter aurantiacus]